MKKCTLLLNTGDQYQGQLIGSSHLASGELVFTTALVGYSETLTDPSYFGQVLIFAYPLIGNYGIPFVDKDRESTPHGFESDTVQVSAVILNAHSHEAFHWSSVEPLDSWLKAHNVVGISGIDTRHLIQKIRQKKRILVKIIPEDSPVQDIDALDFFDPSQADILDHVSTKEPRIIGKGKKRLSMIDCGVKWNIIRQILEEDCEILLLPWNHSLDNIDCSAWFISNGPGDPKRSGGLVARVRKLLQEDTRPLMGICLGHQIIALASGGETRPMLYGHRSHNQPVELVENHKGYITSQNHGYIVEESSLSKEWDIWFRNINDGSIEGIKHKKKPIFSVQFHPEACGGPRDTGWLIKNFIKSFL